MAAGGTSASFVLGDWSASGVVASAGGVGAILASPNGAAARMIFGRGTSTFGSSLKGRRAISSKGSTFVFLGATPALESRSWRRSASARAASRSRWAVPKEFVAVARDLRACCSSAWSSVTLALAGFAVVERRRAISSRALESSFSAVKTRSCCFLMASLTFEVALSADSRAFCAWMRRLSASVLDASNSLRSAASSLRSAVLVFTRCSSASALLAAVRALRSSASSLAVLSGAVCTSGREEVHLPSLQRNHQPSQPKMIAVIASAR